MIWVYFSARYSLCYITKQDLDSLQCRRVSLYDGKGDSFDKLVSYTAWVQSGTGYSLGIYCNGYSLMHYTAEHDLNILRCIIQFGNTKGHGMN